MGADFIFSDDNISKCLNTLQKAIDDLEQLQQQKQISDVEKIADNEREMNAIEKISKLEKALDKACVILNDFHKTQIKEKGFMYLDGRPQKQWWHIQEWKEYLLSEVSND